MRKFLITEKHRSVLFLLTITTLSLVSYVLADPVGPTLTSNSTISQGGTPLTRNDSGGTINILVLDAVQNNPAWKAYVGNVSGTMVLDDSNGYSIYDWELSTVTGEVYASRSSSIDWTNVGCADQAIIDTEQTAMNMGSSDTDNINKTFNYTEHEGFWVSSNNITTNTCRTTYTFVNDSRQPDNLSSFFPEVLLNSSSDFIYSAILEDDQQGFSANPNTTYDFQMLVAEDEKTDGNTVYYFWVELG
jgi:hypothetical protein